MAGRLRQPHRHGSPCPCVLYRKQMFDPASPPCDGRQGSGDLEVQDRLPSGRYLFNFNSRLDSRSMFAQNRRLFRGWELLNRSGKSLPRMSALFRGALRPMITPNPTLSRTASLANTEVSRLYEMDPHIRRQRICFLGQLKMNGDHEKKRLKCSGRRSFSPLLWCGCLRSRGRLSNR